MSDFDYGYERGWWGTDGLPYWDDDEKEVLDRREHIVIELTPSKFLKEHQKNKRDMLFSHSNKYDYLSLKIVHNRYHKNDPYALEVYYQRVFIGYVRKKFDDINKSKQINDFCFIDKFFCYTNISYKKHTLYLYHVDSYTENVVCDNAYNAKLEKNKTYQVQVDNILYKFNNVPQQESESLTIKYALKHKDLFSFTPDMIATLKVRLAIIASETTESAGREIGIAALDVTEKVLEETFSILGKLVNFIQK